MNTVDIITALIALIVVLYGVLVVFRVRDKDEFQYRIKNLMHQRNLLISSQNVKNVYRREQMDKKTTFTDILLRLQVKTEDQKEDLKNELAKAGWISPHAVYVYIFWKWGLTFGGIAAGAFYGFFFTDWSLILKIGCVLFGALVGSKIVDFIVQKAQERRRHKIGKSFPDALDLMVICTESGLSLGMTVQRVAREISQMSPDLGYEFGLLSIEMNLLPSVRTALENFGKRLAGNSYQSMVSALIQSEQYGTPIAQTMRTIAEDFRDERLMNAEERAGKIPVLMTLPMILFIFPSIFIVILGPAGIRIYESFIKM